ncbi:MAG: NADH-dependent alcohol dehydrogenase, partial [Clostridia bacterium]|nr:NADH-dependent alcohol dehydrogenase [Clostridia bacterium]
VVTEADDLLAAREWIRQTASYFASFCLPFSLRELDLYITEDDLDALADNATEGDTLRLSRIRKLDKEAVKAIFAAARG